MSQLQTNIVIFDDEEENEYEEVKGSKTVGIVIFDDQDCLEQDEVIQSTTKSFQRKMSEKEINSQQYKTRCSEIQNKVIMNNLTNLGGVQKWKQNSFKDSKKNGKTTQDFYQKRTSDCIQDIIFQPKSANVKASFGTQQSIITNFQVQVYNKKSIPQSLEHSLTDKTITENITGLSIKRFGQKTSKLSGACISKKIDLLIEQDKNRSLLKVSNFRMFLYTQLKPNYSIYLKIIKTESGLINSTYKIYFNDNDRFIMACQKQGLSKYIFSNSEIHIAEDHISYLGKMETNFFGTQFQIYDSGQEWTTTKMMENYKKQLASIQYTQDDDRPRTISTLITICDNKSTDFTILDKNDNILNTKWKNGNKKNLCQLASKDPVFDPKDSNYKLDLKGLGGIPSIKNFILENENYSDALIFGRQDKDTYVMRVKSPFSLIQAVAIAMSSIHKKIL